MNLASGNYSEANLRCLVSILVVVEFRLGFRNSTANCINDKRAILTDNPFAGEPKLRLLKQWCKVTKHFKSFNPCSGGISSGGAFFRETVLQIPEYPCC